MSARWKMAVAAALVLVFCMAPGVPADRLAPDVSIAESDIRFSNDFPKALETITINVTVHNIGGMDATAVTVLFYQDNDQIPFTPQKTIANIPVNGTGTASATWAGIVPKVYTIHVKVNCTADTNLGNNGATRTITVGVPSGPLVVDMALDPPSCKPGQFFWVNGTVKLATQPQPAAAVTVTVKDRSGVTVGTPAQTTTDASGMFAANLSAPAVAGDYLVEAGASSGGLNGNDTATLRVILPDLLVTIVVFSDPTPKEGDDVRVTATLRNNGTDAAVNVFVAFYDGNTKFASVKVNSLAAGNSTPAVGTWKALKGNHQIRAVADPDNKVAESSEENNAHAVTLTVKENPGGGGIDTLLIFAVVIASVAVAVAVVLVLRRSRASR